MRFEELPANIQELVAGRTGGEIVFRPPPVKNALSEFVRLKHVQLNGLLNSSHLLRPPVAAMPQKMGRGQGFAELKEKIVVSDLGRVVLEIQEEPDCDPSLNFYKFNQIDCYVASADVLGVLKDAGCVGENMYQDVYQLTENGIEPTRWKILDFPLARVVDYSRSSARWGVHFSRENPSLPPVYFPDLIDQPGEIHARPEVHHDISILRDSVRPSFVFVRRTALRQLMNREVKGPDFATIASQALDLSPPDKQ